jgi:hypothetical protein
MGNDGDGPNGSDALWWVVGGTVAAVTLYRLLYPRVEPVMPYLEVKEQSFPDVNSVAVRFGQIRELWSMGYIDSNDAIAQAEKLAAALLELQKAGKAFGVTVENLTTRIDRFVKDVSEYQAAA